MGLREKVALIITVIILIQVIFVAASPERKTIKDENSKKHQKRSLTAAWHPLSMKTNPYVQGLKTKRKELSESSHEVLRKVFNFPDVEYPTASTPRPPFYLQDSNILQRNLIPQTSPSLTLPNPSSSLSVDSGTKNMKFKNKKYKNLEKLKRKNKSGITNTLSEFGNSANPYHKQELFPEVEYPLNAMETWKPKYWQQMRSYGQKKHDINKLPNCPVDSDVKLSSKLLKKKSGTSVAAPKLISSKKIKDSTKTTVKSDTTEVPVPLTSCTSSYLDTTSLGTDRKIYENTTPAPPKKSGKKKDKKKKKSMLKKNSKTPLENDTSKEGGVITTLPYSVTSVLQDEVLQITKTQDDLVTFVPNEPRHNGNVGEVDTCSNISNQTVSSNYVSTTTPPYVRSYDAPFISPSKIRNDDKMPLVSCDNKVGSLSDAINTVVFENNNDSCFEDNAINSNKSLAFDADEEFTTDVFPDFDENMLSVSTSTMSPMALDIEEFWANSVVLDPYNSVAYPDELEQCYIALP